MKTINYNEKFIFQTGFSLLELLISMALGLLLMAMLIKIYTWQLEIHHHLSDKAYLQSNGVIAMQILGEEIRTAGYVGCARLRPGLIIDMPKTLLFSSATALQILPSDQFGNNQINIDKMATDNNTFITGDEVVIANCQQVKVITYAAKQKKDYQNYQVGKFIDESFYIDKANRSTAQGKPVFALFRVENVFNGKKLPREELVEGVQQLHAEAIMNDEQQIVAVYLQLQLVAPYGMKQELQATFALREKIS